VVTEADYATDDYYNRLFDMREDIIKKLTQFELGDLHAISKYLDNLKSQQRTRQVELFSQEAKCPICSRILIKPRRGPMPKFCSGKCRTKNYRAWMGV